MTPEAQRIAIAEACGWTLWPKRQDSFGVWCEPAASRGQVAILQTKLPDYLSDLNAIHTAEASLPEHQRMAYIFQLIEVCSGKKQGNGEAVFATAAQRAKAFLRTVGKWDDIK